MYLTAGFVKVLLLIYIPVFRAIDYTVLIAILLLIIMAFYFFKNRGELSAVFNKPVMFFFLLCLFLLFGATFTSAPVYGWIKSTRVATLGSIALLAPLFMILNLKKFNEFVAILFVVGLIIAVGTAIAPQAGFYRSNVGLRGSFLEADPLESASKISIALIIAFYYGILSISTIKTKIVLLISMPLLLFALVLTGSRGPFLGVIICSLAGVFLARKNLSAMSVVLTFALVLSAIFYIFLKAPEEQTHRIAQFFQGKYEAGQAMEARSGLFGWVIENSFNSPVWGNGTGSFAMDHGQVDERLYPHNMFLELFYENGIVGLALLLIFLWLVFKRWRMARYCAAQQYSPQIAQIVNLFGLLAFYNFIQSMKSNDLDGNRFFFFTCGLILAAYTCLKKNDACEAVPEFTEFCDNVDSCEICESSCSNNR
jgi:O-antigen ligase